MLKKMLVVVFSVFLCVCFVSPIRAYNADGLSGMIELDFDNIRTRDISFAIYKVGNLVDGSLVQYELAEEFAGLNVDLNDLTTAKDCQRVISKCIDLIDDAEIKWVQCQSGNSEGNVVFDDLELGLYLIRQVNAVDDFKAEDTLISVPLNYDGNLVYDVVAIPKYSHQDIPDKPDNPVINVDTGDDKDVSPYVITLGISLVAMGLIYFFIRKDKIY